MPQHAGAVGWSEGWLVLINGQRGKELNDGIYRELMNSMKEIKPDVTGNF